MKEGAVLEIRMDVLVMEGVDVMKNRGKDTGARGNG